MKTNIVGDTRTRTMDLEDGSQVRYRYTKTFPIAITRKREMEFSNPTLQVKYEHNPGIWSKNKGTRVIAYCLSYNIFEAQRKLS